ncbi:hypothetical protein GGF32_002406 [Allomyces javanicus]|nr:hypothetical protein GGF32_002406 [Allomyces javanicus]
MHFLNKPRLPAELLSQVFFHMANDTDPEITRKAFGLINFIDDRYTAKRMVAKHAVLGLRNALRRNWLEVLEWHFEHNSQVLSEWRPCLHDFTHVGAVESLDWALEHGVTFLTSRAAVHYAPSAKILSWLAKNQTALQMTRHMYCSKSILYRASLLGLVDVLEWWSKFRSPCKSRHRDIALDIEGIVDICENGQVDVLEWWKQSGHPISVGTQGGKVAQYYTQWWTTSTDADHINPYLRMHLDSIARRAIHRASLQGHIRVLEWWKCNGFNMEPTQSTMMWLTKQNHIDVLEWWRVNFPTSQLVFTNVMEEASLQGNVMALEWWKNSGYRVVYQSSARGPCRSQLVASFGARVLD